MTEEEWLACTDPDAMLNFLRGKASERKLRLFAVACCRRIWHLLTDERSRAVVNSAEQFAEGEIAFETFRGVLAGPNQTKDVVADLCQREAWWAANMVVLDAASKVCEASWDPTGERYKAEMEAQCRLVRELFGNPFQPAFIHPRKLGKNKSRTLTLAHAIYDDRAFDRLPILADTLEEAGCHNADILNHCRQPDEHVRGCWVVDMLLGKS